MSDLQISLMAIGAVVIAAVWAFNSWQERQLRRRTEQAFAREHPDVLLERSEPAELQRIEPGFNVNAEPAMAPAPAPVPVSNPTPVSLPPLQIDPVIDFVVEVHLAAASEEAAALREELRALLGDAGKTVLAEGYVESSGDWVDVAGAFQRLRFALQISNRGGCVTQTQLASFRDAVDAWATARDGTIKALDVEAVHAMAVQLDRFCADVDIAIGINVITGDGSPFTGSRIRTLAEKLGLKLSPEGVFAALAAGGELLFTLDNHEPMPFVPEKLRALHTRGVTFLLDVPRVTRAIEAFDSMLSAARSFAAEMGGTLVDDNRAELTDGAIAAIRNQLTGILAKMEAGRIAAGGVRALRLFG